MLCCILQQVNPFATHVDLHRVAPRRGPGTPSHGPGRRKVLRTYHRKCRRNYILRPIRNVFFIATPRPAVGVLFPSVGTPLGISVCVRSQSSKSTIEQCAAECRRAMAGSVTSGCNPQEHWQAWHETCRKSIGLVVCESRGAAPD